jgi:hypothetical protein
MRWFDGTLAIIGRTVMHRGTHVKLAAAFGIIWMSSEYMLGKLCMRNAYGRIDYMY